MCVCGHVRVRPCAVPSGTASAIITLRHRLVVGRVLTATTGSVFKLLVVSLVRISILPLRLRWPSSEVSPGGRFPVTLSLNSLVSKSTR